MEPPSKIVAQPLKAKKSPADCVLTFELELSRKHELNRITTDSRSTFVTMEDNNKGGQKNPAQSNAHCSAHFLSISLLPCQDTVVVVV
jgi:hypothetical protein